jgi:hypothetical protein
MIDSQELKKRIQEILNSNLSVSEKASAVKKLTAEAKDARESAKKAEQDEIKAQQKAESDQKKLDMEEKKLASTKKVELVNEKSDVANQFWTMLRGDRGEKGEIGPVGPKSDVPGPIGPRGKDGKTPVAGVDFPLPKDGESIVGPPGRDGESVPIKEVVVEVIKQIKLPEEKEKILDTADDIKRKLETLKEDQQLKGIKDLKWALGVLDQRTQYLINKPSGGGSGSSSFIGLTDVPATYTGQALKVVSVNAGETALVFTTLAGGGDALVANPLSQFAATTSLQLKNTISDETGSGALVFATSPTLVTPALGTPASGVMTNVTGTAAGLTAGTVTTNANLTGHVTSTGNAAVLGSFTKAQLDTAVSDGNIIYAGDLKEKIGFTSDGGGSAIATGKVKGFMVCPYAGTISAWNIIADTGTATVKVWKIATGTAKPTSANSINTSGVALSTGTAVRSTTTSDFTSTAVSANDIFAFNIEALTGATELTFVLEITRT